MDRRNFHFCMPNDQSILKNMIFCGSLFVDFRFNLRNKKKYLCDPSIQPDGNSWADCRCDQLGRNRLGDRLAFPGIEHSHHRDCGNILDLNSSVCPLESRLIPNIFQAFGLTQTFNKSKSIKFDWQTSHIKHFRHSMSRTLYKNRAWMYKLGDPRISTQAELLDFQRNYIENASDTSPRLCQRRERNLITYSWDT